MLNCLSEGIDVWNSMKMQANITFASPPDVLLISPSVPLHYQSAAASYLVDKLCSKSDICISFLQDLAFGVVHRSFSVDFLSVPGGTISTFLIREVFKVSSE